MRTKLILSFLILVIRVPGYSQNQNGLNLSDLKLSYGTSFLVHQNPVFIGEDYIPYGIGLSFNLDLNKRLSSDIGLTFRTTGKLNYNGSMLFGDQILTINPFVDYHHEHTDNFFNVPIHINYSVTDLNRFGLLISFGPVLSLHNYDYYANPNFWGEVQRSSGSNFGIGWDLGLIEGIKLTQKLGLFSSQYLECLFISKFSNLQSLNLNLGLTYSFNQ